jgi:hypothetical protein
MNLFKIFIPKEKAQQVTTLESWTVTWEVKQGWSDKTDTYHKVFINEQDRDEFIKQLKESAQFIGAWIRVNMCRN